MSIQLIQRISSANCQVNPIATDRCTVVRNLGEFQANHWRYGNNQELVLEIDLPAPLQQIEVRVNGLVSRLEPNEGYSPITLLANGQPIVSDYTMPGAGYQPHKAAFHVPQKLLKVGKNQIALRISGQAKSFFWLYGIDLLLLDGFTCNLTVDPPVTDAGLVLTRKAGMFQNDHLRCSIGDGVTLALHLPKPQTDHAGLVVGIYGLVSRNGDHDGFSPVDILVNGKVIASRVSISPGGYSPELAEYFAPADILKEGDNSIGLQVCNDAQTVFWLYKINVIPVGYGA